MVVVRPSLLATSAATALWSAIAAIAIATVAALGTTTGVDASARPALSTTLDLEITAQEVLARTEDVKEGVRAAAERRAPHFEGR